MKIQVAGPGCGRCQTTEKHVRDAVQELRLQADVTHVLDVREYARLGVRLTPAVIVDGRIVCSGKVPTVEEVKQLLA
jgi:small redox-active disulfide protein 2